MEPMDILQADPLDILFEHRNKDYGAYPLRKFYNRRLLVALGVMLATVLIASFFILLHKPVFVKPVTVSGVISLINPIPEKPAVKPPKPAVLPPAVPKTRTASIKEVTLLIVKENDVPPIPEIKALEGKTIAAVTNAGAADNGPGGPAGTTGRDGNGLLPAADSASGLSDDKIYSDGVEQMPEFPGGADALKRFLSRNLHAPETGQEAGTQVRVLARFVVNKDGNVSGMEINHSGGGEYDREVLRVIQRMPRWKPGLQHNHPVNVYYMLPVVFTVSE